MKLAVVFDTPRVGDPLKDGIGGVYFARTLEACRRLVKGPVELRSFVAVEERQPGGKAPNIKLVRDQRQRLTEELDDWEPDRVLTVGASALNALAGEKKVLAISKQRGRMRYDYAGRPWVPTISNMAVIARSDLHRDFANDLYKVLAQDRPIPPMRIDTVVPESLDDLEHALHMLEGASVVAVDVETTGLKTHSDQVLAVGFGAVYDDDAGLSVVVSRKLLADPTVDDMLWDATWRMSRKTVGHNFKFDMQFLEPYVGWPPDGADIGDTLLLSHLLDERPNRPTSRVRGLGLKDQVAVRYDLQYGFDFEDFYARTMSPDEGESEAEFKVRMGQLFDEMHTYLGQDVCYTARLWHDLAREAEEESPRILTAHDTLLMPVSKSIARMELAGSPINVAWTAETVALYDRRAARRKEALERQLAVLVPGVNVDITKPAQVADLMYDDWKMTPDVRKHGRSVSGDRSTDKDHIKAAVAKYLGTELDRQARWLRSLERYRRDVRQRTTYQKSLLDRVDDKGRVHPSFLIHGTSTGRLSAQGPAIQTIPAINREDSIQFRPMRRAFQPKAGWLWVEVDYSQLELRVAAALSGDEALTQVFRSGRDVHREIASAIFSKPPEQISDAERFLAKAVSFGIIYGRGGDALANGAEMAYAERVLGMKRWTPDVANAFIRKFLRDYPTLDAWMKELYETVPKQGYVESPFGRRRRFPLSPRSKGELGSIQRQAVNTPVQSAASDICLEAMIRVQDGIADSGMRARVLFPVHDSICIEVHEDWLLTLKSLCKEAMERDFMGVPLTVDFEAGPTWADVEKIR